MLKCLLSGFILLGLHLCPLMLSEAAASEKNETQQFRRSNPDVIARRAAFRKLIATPTADSLLKSALDDPDRLIRKRAVFEYYARNGMKVLKELEKLAADPDPLVMSTLIACGKDMKEKHNSMQLLETISRQSVLSESRRQADKLVNFTFYRENKRLKANPAYDHEIVTEQLFQLPLDGWRFRADATATGHKKGYYKNGFDDSTWKPFRIGYWEEQGYDGYDGIAWYRLSFEMPSYKKCAAVELAFGAVDESAWVWLNGIYIGQHDIGPSGWNRAFWLDVTKEIRWGEKNLLVIRVEDTVNGGGVWKPVSVEILK